ncbi:hypothetical protein JOL79_06765 [Microbispora sp. RL4-1S]|uniref:Uncharacterized protein n=1 Tax=Microbispora oryzae TaxID=2806554 RepID=A0A941APA4_9ACTN|nr:hypothetical protein [Microbispora oryzae]MBP2703499.1 hypothetical protein [Microbispora oryzae]
MTAPFTAAQVADMRAHVGTCPYCTDPDALAAIDRGLPDDELAAYIAGAHDPAWLDFVARHTPAAGTETPT